MQFQFTGFLIDCLGQTVDGETEIRQDFVIDDVVMKDGVRIKSLRAQDNAVIECLIFADDLCPVV